MSALESDHELHALLGTQAHGHTLIVIYRFSVNSIIITQDFSNNKMNFWFL